MKMDTEPALKVRIVRCPKCLFLLPEPENVSVYRCGKCSTVLQAKKRNNDVRRHSAGLHGTEAAQMNESDRVSEVKDSISSSQRATLSSSSERFLDQNIERGQDISGDCTSEKFGGANPSNEDQNDESCHNDARNCDIDQPGVSDKFCSSSELAHRGNEDSAQSKGANSEVEVNDESSHLAGAKSAVDINNESDPISRSPSAETSAVARGSNSIVTYHRPAGESLSSDALMSSPDEQPKQLQCVRSNDASRANSETEESDGSSQFVEAQLAVDTDDESDSISRKSNTENSVVTGEHNSTVTYHRPAVESNSSEVEDSAHRGNEDSAQSKGANSEVEVNDESSHLAGAKSAVDINNESDPISRSSSAETSAVARGSNSIVTYHRPAGESLSSDALMSSPDEQPKQLQCVRSNDASRANSETEESDGSSQFVEAQLAVDTDDESDSISRKSNTENSVVTGEHNSTVTYHRPAVESNSSEVEDSAHRGNEDSAQSKGANSEVEVNDESSHLAGAKSAVDINNESDPISRSSSAETSAVARGSNSIVTYHRPAGESLSSDALMSSPDEQPKQLQCVRSNDASRANSETEESDGSSQFVEAQLAVDTDDESDSISRKSNTENSVVTGEHNSTVTYHRPAVESNSSEVLISSPDERPEQLLTHFKHGYDRVRSNDAFEENVEVEVNDQSTHLAEAKPEVNIYNEIHESDSTSRSSNAEDAVVTRENNSAVTSHRPAGESVLSDIFVSSPDEQQKRLWKNSDHVRSDDAFGANSEVEVNDQSSQLVEAISAVEVSNFRSLNTENTVVTADVTSHTPAGERVSSEILVSSPDEQLKPRLWTSFKHGSGRVRSNDTFDSTSFHSPSSELSTIDYMTKSPTTRSAHAYDGSVSSFDGIDDQVPHRQLNSYGNTNKFVSSVVSEERTRRDTFPVNGNPEMRHRMRKLSPVLSDKRQYAMNHRKWDSDELLDSTRHGHAVRNGTRYGRDECQSPAHLYPRDYLAGYESGSTSSQLQDEFHNRSREQEKIKLLRMVYELQDQLKRTGYVNETASYRGSSEVSAKEKYVPAYYSREITDEEISHELLLNYRRYPEKYRQGNNWSHQYKYSCIPYSGEVSNNGHCLDSSCLHCCPQDWQYSTQLPPSICSHSRGFSTLRPGHSCYSSYRSCPSSPQQFTDSEYPIRYRETKSDDQRHEEYHVKRHTKEQSHLVKRHLRPTAGGAPFIICYRCLKPLQLPADFLLFKRRFHPLKCGACAEVLKFSLENKIHIVPYTPRAEASSQSEIVDYRGAVNRTILSSSNSNDYLQADPVSCSDDYGLSHCKSYSTDGDPVLFTPFRNMQGNNSHAQNMCNNSPESTTEGNRLVPKQFQNKNKSPMETCESAGTSSHKSRSGKVSSEIKELPVKSGSPLHWLMGYNSPSQVLRGSGPSSSATSSFYS